MPEAASQMQSSQDVKRPQFPLPVRVYFGMFFALVCLIPLGLGKIVAAGGAVAPRYIAASLIWSILIAVSFLYAQARCSSERLHSQDGLQWVTASMMTGWTYMSFATVFPALAVSFFGSILIALAGDLRGDKTYAPDMFAWLVRFFYRNRMRR